jgi:hypothetical protein
MTTFPQKISGICHHLRRRSLGEFSAVLKSGKESAAANRPVLAAGGRHRGGKRARAAAAAAKSGRAGTRVL